MSAVDINEFKPISVIRLSTLSRSSPSRALTIAPALVSGVASCGFAFSKESENIFVQDGNLERTFLA